MSEKKLSPFIFDLTQWGLFKNNFSIRTLAERFQCCLRGILWLKFLKVISRCISGLKLIPIDLSSHIFEGRWCEAKTFTLQTQWHVSFLPFELFQQRHALLVFAHYLQHTKYVQRWCQPNVN